MRHGNRWERGAADVREGGGLSGGGGTGQSGRMPSRPGGGRVCRLRVWGGVPGPVVGWLLGWVVWGASLGSPGVCGADRVENAGGTERERLQRALGVLDRGSEAYAERRQCFACHHQAVPMAAHRAARRWREGEPARETALTEFTLASFQPRLEAMREGTGVGGRGMTAGYALWQLRLGEHRADEVTEGLVEYLLQTQEEGGDWRLDAVRPPAEESRAMAVVLAGLGVAHYATAGQRERAEECLRRARDWLQREPVVVHEDRVARVWGTRLPGVDREWSERVMAELRESQAPDGGWRPTADFPTDAYATATAVYVLLEAGVAGEDPGIERGAEWLWRAQEADGSWHVPTRATPVQVFFDNGDPHGRDQFVSMLATGWATAALSRLQPPAGEPVRRENSGRGVPGGD